VDEAALRAAESVAASNIASMCSWHHVVSEEREWFVVRSRQDDMLNAFGGLCTYSYEKKFRGEF
jgi:hypothetical protein